MNRLTWLIVLILACLSVLITIALIWRHYAEPTYEGRTLSKWLASGASQSSLELSNSQHAIRQIGTNAIPCLLRWMSFEPSPLRYKILGLSSRLPGTLPQKVYPYLSGDPKTSSHKPHSSASVLWAPRHAPPPPN